MVCRMFTAVMTAAVVNNAVVCVLLLFRSYAQYETLYVATDGIIMRTTALVATAVYLLLCRSSSAYL
jgi:hypothetical protein